MTDQSTDVRRNRSTRRLLVVVGVAVSLAGVAGFLLAVLT